VYLENEFITTSMCLKLLEELCSPKWSMWNIWKSCEVVSAI